MWSKIFGHEAGDSLDGAAVLHQLPEQRPKQEQGKELSQKFCRTAHERLCPMRKQRRTCRSRRHQSGGRCQQQHAPAAKGEPNQQSERGQDAKQTHGSALCQQHVDIRGRALTKVFAVLLEEGAGGPPALGTQHQKEVALTIQLG